MSQKLKMPFKSQMMLCGYKNGEYRKYWGYDHYGVDISTIQGNAGKDHKIYASGNGEVIAVGKDNTLGYGVVILYADCESRSGEVKDLAVKYMHMKECFVTLGEVIEDGELIGVEGKEGTGDYHLHLEMDTDVDYPTYTPQVSNGHTFWKKGVDTTVNPSLWLFVGDGQKIVEPIYNPAWLNKEDFDIPEYKENEEEMNMAKMQKLPINEEVPLNVIVIEDGEEVEVEAYGEQVWAYVKNPNLAYGFITYDKYMRRTPCWWTDFGGEFVEEEYWDKLVPISEVSAEHLIPRGETKFVPTDTTNYDHLFDIDPEEPDEPVTPDEPDEPVKPDEPVDPSVPVVCPFAGRIEKIRKLAEEIIRLCEE